MIYQDIVDGKIEFVMNPSVVFKDMDGTLVCYIPETGKYYRFTDQERELIEVYLDCEGDNKIFFSKIKDNADLLKKAENFFQELKEATIIIVVEKNGATEEFQP